MRAAVITKRFVEPEAISTVLEMKDDFPHPPHPMKGQMLVRVRACALAPGDVRVLRGDAGRRQRPHNMPYIPGGDLCGEVVVVDPADPAAYAVGDRIIAMFIPDVSQDGLAEFALVRTSHCTRAPPDISDAEAAALPSSALAAMIISRLMRRGDRVLILGAAGGVGSHLVQFARSAGVTFVAATTSEGADHLKRLGGVDLIIDHTTQRWWEVQELLADPVDVIVDLASEPDNWARACSEGIVKAGAKGGQFITTMPGTARPVIKSPLDTAKIVGRIVSHLLHAKVAPNSVPKYIMPMCLVPGEQSTAPARARDSDWSTGVRVKVDLPHDETNIQELARRVASGEVRAVVDKAGPFPFTAEGVAHAFQLQASRHAHGKVVVTVTTSGSSADKPGSK